ncbi:MAG: CDP-diacylglycerol--glycerol-3-phosphate 3-phosphatidyltransferase [Alicyclobacillaceae bacterium]|nr:CDP-diacylglycerol--glycerol-3-phosphate 3-phosphatidyltransferase [Alicyclobacillaceae bacterium]
MNLANRITIARIFLVPVVMFFLLVRYDFGRVTVAGQTLTVNEIVAALIFIVAASTDGLDGYIARKRRIVTNFGKFLDPLADKLLISAVLVSLVEMQRLEAWEAIVIISREFAVTGLRLVAAAEGTVIAASRLGKWKTVTQIVAVVALIMNNLPFSYFGVPVAEWIMYAAVAITVISGIDYFIKNKHVIGLGKT